MSVDDKTADRPALWQVLLDYLQVACSWPGADGLTIHDALTLYQHAAAARQVPPLANLVQQYPEVAELLAKPVPRSPEPTVGELSPRLRQVLRCLLEGDSERQVALKLELTTGTVHQYVKSLYRRFGTNSRSGLLALFLRRHGFRLDEIT